MIPLPESDSPSVFSQPISRQHVADCSWHGQDGNSHHHRPPPQYSLPVHRPGRQRLRPEWPKPHLWASPDTRSVRTRLTPTPTRLSSRPQCDCVCFSQMWVLQVRVWTTGRCRESWERWLSSCKSLSLWHQPPSECPGLWVAQAFVSSRKKVVVVCEASLSVSSHRLYCSLLKVDRQSQYVQGYRLFYRPSGASWLLQDIHSPSERSTVLTSLLKGTEYEIKIRPYFDEFQGKDSRTLLVRTPEEGHFLNMYLTRCLIN